MTYFDAQWKLGARSRGEEAGEHARITTEIQSDLRAVQYRDADFFDTCMRPDC